MGIKSLSLQMIPWCFPVMGGAACHHPDPPSSPSPATKFGAGKTAPLCIRLIRADGRVEVYHRPVSAVELMKEHPMHLVCRSDAFTIGQRIPALAEGDQLEPGHAYFLLPLHFFQSVLSFVTLASSFARAASAAAAVVANGSGPSSGSSPLLQRPFDVHKTPSGKLQVRVSDEFIRRVQEAQEAEERAVDGGGSSGGGGRVCTTAALEKDYQQLVVGFRERQWKPKLETIREAERRKGKLAAVRRRKKKGDQGSGDANGQDQKEQPPQKQQQKEQKQQQQLLRKEEKQKQQQEQKEQKQQLKEQKKEQKEQKRQQQEKKQKQMVSIVAKRPSSPSNLKSKEKKVVVAFQQ